MLHIALTGGIGSGKSTAADILVECGAALIDADVLARAAVDPGTRALDQIVEEFGPGVLSESGALNRGALASIVFDDEGARRRLNSIVHPAVREAAESRRRDVLADDPCAVIVEDIPLLAETGGAGRFHAVAVVHAPLALRLARLERRGTPRADAQARIAAQATDDDREVIGDVLLRNDTSWEELRTQVRRAWADRLVPYRDALVRGEAPEVGRVEPPPGHLERVITRVRAAIPDSEVSTRPSALTITAANPGVRESSQLVEKLRRAGFIPATHPTPGGPRAALAAPAATQPGRWFVSADPAARVHLQVR